MYRLVAKPECFSIVDQGNVLIVTEGRSPEVTIKHSPRSTNTLKREGVATNWLRQCMLVYSNDIHELLS